MMLKIAYLGEKFYGFVKQPGLRTVEGDVLNALDRIGLNPRSEIKIYPASRTDRGVSALCNVIRVGIEREDICRILTALLTDVWVYGYTFSDWNPRHCTKHYIYFLSKTYDTEKMGACCSLFSGVHDFSAFTRAKENTVKEINVSFKVKENVTLLHFAGRSFLWEMIRRCVTGMENYLSGKWTESELNCVLEGRSEKVPPAPAENLLLADLEYESSFLLDQFSIERMQKEFSSRYRIHSMKKVFFKELLDILP